MLKQLPYFFSFSFYNTKPTAFCLQKVTTLPKVTSYLFVSGLIQIRKVEPEGASYRWHERCRLRFSPTRNVHPSQSHKDASTHGITPERTWFYDAHVDSQYNAGR